MNELKIEKGIPIPKHKGNSKNYSEALRKLEVNDSILLPTSIQNGSNIAAHALGKGNYVSRTVEGGTRVWRIK